MTIEQWIVRLILVLPSFVLMLLFLPYKGGGYQFLGILDREFLLSGAIHFPRLLIQVAILLVAWVVLELYAGKSMDLFPVRDERGYLKQRR
ncbi:MAG: hypothetical protein ACYDBB_20495 [Armatimonadota bacterium]